jgi:hypothetical protein
MNLTLHCPLYQRALQGRGQGSKPKKGFPTVKSLGGHWCSNPQVWCSEYNPLAVLVVTGVAVDSRVSGVGC